MAKLVRVEPPIAKVRKLTTLPTEEQMFELKKAKLLALWKFILEEGKTILGKSQKGEFSKQAVLSEAVGKKP